MNNIELLKEFRKIEQNSNPFDCIILLKKFNKQYKKSEFYKTTKINIFKAYEIFSKMTTPTLLSKINELLESDNLAMYLNDILNELDISVVLNRFLYGINYEQLQETLQKLVPNMSIEELQEMGKDLQGAIDKLKN